jgi:hypothetical protein
MEVGTGYEIRIRGHLNDRWMHVFEDLMVAQRPEGETVISGAMDQARLHGILNRIRDLGLVLVSVQRFSASNHHDQATI